MGGIFCLPKGSYMKKIFIIMIVCSLFLLGECLFSACDKVQISRWETDDFQFNLKEDGTYEISAATPNAGALLEIPAEYRGIAITSIKERGFINNTGIEKLVIPSSITHIWGKAFFGCSGLKTINFLREEDFYIGIESFGGCTGLRLVEGSIWTMSTFTNSPLRSVCIALIDGVNPENLQSQEISNDYKMKAHFYDCDELDSIRIPNDGNFYTFQLFGTENLTSITIPDGVTEIFVYAPKSSQLTSITIPKSVKYGMGTITHPNDVCVSVYYQGSLAEWCAVENLEIKSTDDLYINGTKLEGNVVIPDGVTTVGNCSFTERSGITSITLPASITSIIEYNFSFCRDLVSVTLPSSIASIDHGAFCGCTSLTSIDFQGTIEQWQAIKKGYSWDAMTGDYVVYCTNGNIPKA